MAQQHCPEKEEELRRKIEEVTGINPRTPRDYDILAAAVLARTRQRISSTTLKRFWKYIEKENDTQTRLSVLDILATFIGYTSWDAFCDIKEDNGSSDFILTNELKVTNLKQGTLLRIVWNPERSITVRYEGSDLLTVLESVNSKLSKDDTFHCTTIVDYQPLLLTEVVHEDMAPCSFICGRYGGVKVTIL